MSGIHEVWMGSTGLANFDFQLFQNIVDVSTGLGIAKRLFFDEVDLVVKFV
jgi:hypothetical protein